MLFRSGGDGVEHGVDRDARVRAEELRALGERHRVAKDITHRGERRARGTQQAELGLDDGFRDGEDRRFGIERVMDGLGRPQDRVLDRDDPAE